MNTRGYTRMYIATLLPRLGSETTMSRHRENGNPHGYVNRQYTWPPHSKSLVITQQVISEFSAEGCMQRTEGFFDFGSFRLDADDRVLLRDARVVPLPPKAFSVLLLLLRRQGRIVAKAEFMREVWTDDEVEEGNLTQNIFQIRKAFREQGANPNLVETIPRRGYRFTGTARHAAGSEMARQTRGFGHGASNPTAHAAYLKGRYYLSKCTRRGLERSIEYFRKALDHDPAFAIAYVGMADSYAFLATSHASAAEMMPKAKAALLQALRVDDEMPEAHASLGMLKLRWDLDWPGARSDFVRALQLKPDYATAHLWHGNYFDVMGRFDDSLEQKRRALELDPLSLRINISIAATLWLMRRSADAFDITRETLEMDQNFFNAHLMLGLIYEQIHDLPNAVASIERARQIDDAPIITAHLARAYAMIGKSNKARVILRDLQKHSSGRCIEPYAVALIESSLGHDDRALNWLEKAHEERDGWLGWLNVDPRLDHLRANPRFKRLIQRVGVAGSI